MNSNTITFNGLGLEFEIDRVAFTLFGRDFYWYGLIIACAFLVAVLYGYRRAPQFGIVRDNLIDQLLVAVPIALICTRLYYVIFNFSLYKNDLSKIFRFWDGGLAIYGGIIGAVIGVVIYCRIKKIKIGAMLDLASLGLLIGQAIGRWGNFVNKEAFGTVTDLPWRMGIYKSGALMEVHPTFLYESLWNIVGFVILHFFTKKKKRRYDGQVFLMYIAWYGLGRGMIEGLRTDSLMLFGTGLRVSQVLGFASFVVALLIMLYNEIFKKHSVEEMQVYRMEHPEEFAASEAEKADSGDEEIIDDESMESKAAEPEDPDDAADEPDDREKEIAKDAPELEEDTADESEPVEDAPKEAEEGKME